MKQGTAAWQPSSQDIHTANLTPWLKKYNCKTVSAFHQWTCEHGEVFWEAVINTLSIKWMVNPKKIVDLSQGVENPNWLPDAKLNIAESCLQGHPTQTALIYQDGNTLKHMTYAELNARANNIAASLVQLGVKQGEPIAIAMAMNHEAVAIYLGIIKMGGVVVSIADSFSTPEINTRLEIAKAKLIFTQDVLVRNGKTHPLYDRVKETNIARIILLRHEQTAQIKMRPADIFWESFLLPTTEFDAVPCNPMSNCTILFSSGTTATPKAIPWNHTTAIKAASDAYFHQNIKQEDVLCWPTNLGWMMGPWLIYAALINRASIALYTDIPTNQYFGQFIQDAKVTMLGVVPTLVASWRETHCMAPFDWSAIKLFSSTGECSNEDDMRYLMQLGKNKPVIEYCGGTEIGGAYLSSTVLQANYPALFSTPTMGTAIAILNENGDLSDTGEVAIIPPTMGLSTHLLNANHHDIYFSNMPAINNKILRRHGDQIIRYDNGYYAILGRVDDAMNLGGIKISAAEIERAVAGCEHVIETAAIAVSPKNHGASKLVIFAVSEQALDNNQLLKEMQHKINTNLNPLFKISEVVLVSSLPKTASNKIMRRKLRER